MKRSIALGIVLCLISNTTWSLKKGRGPEGTSERQTKKEMLSAKLLTLIAQGQAESLQLIIDLLAQGADANVADEWGSALHYACSYDDYGLVRLLLENGAQVNARGLEDFTPLHIAAVYGYKEVCELLVGHGAEVNAQDSEGVTPLYCAVQNAHKDACPKGCGLHLAEDAAHKEVCKLLIDRGAQVDAQNSQGISPLHIASFYGRKEMCELLIYAGARVNARLSRDFVFNTIAMGRFTALHLAVFNNKLEVVKILLQAGADRNTRTQDGRTALDIARQQGYTELVTYLKK